MPKPKLVVIGSGFAAFSLIKKIDVEHYDVTIISKRNHFLYTPLLPSTVVGTIEFRTIIESIRSSREGIRFYQGEATEIDAEANVVHCRNAHGSDWQLHFDSLVIAVGADCQTFGIEGVAAHCKFLKELSDAREIRMSVIDCLETACAPGVDDHRRDELLHFIGVGAGPTGVRFAAELSDLLDKELRELYPTAVDRIRITLLDAGKSILSSYDQRLQDFTADHFRRKNISIRTECFVDRVAKNEVQLKTGERLRGGVILWSTGFAPTPFIKSLPFEKTRNGRLVVDDHLRLAMHPNIFALGDCATPPEQNYPQLAQVAGQQGSYLAKALNSQVKGREAKPFRWKNLGVSSYIGESKAVAEGPGEQGKYTGAVAYQLWRTTMFRHLLSAKNRVLVPLGRMKSAMFGREMSRF